MEGNKTMTSKKRKHPSFFYTGFACLALCMCLLLSGCGESPVQASSYVPTPENYQVCFFLKDQLLLEDVVVEGERVQPVRVDRSGLSFFGWRDVSGNPVVPEEETVTGNTAYFAYAFPRLSNHVPYLFTDESGFLRPDDPLTEAELADAVDALAEPDAVKYLPFLSRSSQTFTAEQLQETLCKIFPGEAVRQQFSGMEGTQTITRADAACILNTLLGRSADETVTIRRDGVRPLDVSNETEYALELLEASVSHTPDDWGDHWTSCTIPSRFEEGRHLLNGRLYCTDEQGCVCRNVEIDGFTFGPDGIYTSGSAELDGIVAGIVDELSSQSQRADELELLRLAYDYCRDSFTYLRKAPLSYGETGWEIDYALQMFNEKLGNCYNYASTFWSIARALGYDARIYSGTVGTTRSPHGFVEIEIGGVNYTFDVELEMAYRGRGNYSNDMFMMPQSKAATWNYRRVTA